jgi:hypothetical protein
VALNRFEGLDGITERPLGQHVCILSARGFDSSSCTVDDMEFKTRECSIVPVGRRGTSRLKMLGRDFLCDGDKGHRCLFADVSAGEHSVRKAGSLFTTMKGLRTTADESKGNDTDDDDCCQV